MADENDNLAGPSRLKQRKLESSLTEVETSQILEKLSDLYLDGDFDSGSEDECVPFDDTPETSDAESSDIEENIVPVLTQQQVPPVSENIIWENDSTSMKRFYFMKTENLLQSVKSKFIADCHDYFFHILTYDYLGEIVTQTNRYAAEIFLRPQTKEKSRVTTWKDVSMDEMLVFLGLLLHMGNIRLKRIQDYWKGKDSLFSSAIFANRMSCDRFLLILRALHFAKNPDNDGVASADRLYKIRNIVNFFNSRMSEIFSPGREISLDLDESMILWRGRQCTTNKYHKYGIKLYMLTTSEGIILKLMAYTGMLDDRDRKGHSEKVVMNLLQGMLDVGHSLYINNYYNSYELMKRLTDRKTYCTGTIRSNGKSFPTEVRDKKLKKGETIAKYANGIMIGKWKDKRDVAYISNEHQNYMVKVQNKRKETKSKPLPIISYNKYMSGIGGQDQMLALANYPRNYPRERKTFTWYSKIFVHILQLMMINAHQLYNKYSVFKVSLYDFRLIIIRHLLNFDFDSASDPGIVEHPLKTLTEEGKIVREGLYCHNCSLRIRKFIPTDYFCTICQGAPGYCLDCAKITHV